LIINYIRNRLVKSQERLSRRSLIAESRNPLFISNEIFNLCDTERRTVYSFQSKCPNEQKGQSSSPVVDRRKLNRIARTWSRFVEGRPCSEHGMVISVAHPRTFS